MKSYRFIRPETWYHLLSLWIRYIVFIWCCLFYFFIWCCLFFFLYDAAYFFFFLYDAAYFFFIWCCLFIFLYDAAYFFIFLYDAAFLLSSLFILNTYSPVAHITGKLLFTAAMDREVSGRVCHVGMERLSYFFFLCLFNFLCPTVA